ncbi:FRG domain-containing protein [Halomonas sp. HP20-15]|uniref:FRG domain-containing protein n=1 Tax=Halomonas sp. HP20-15 TaxID=3085901 RepID=UPI00298205A9|nr:FRG domain-containing protein [Halomonas sp. HP20-15]MDW5377280.1 FRG domain-containing protein [Halomonas sp. HP20-15]
MPVAEVEVESLSNLVEEVLIKSREMPSDRFFWFRGLPKKSYSLKPGLLRDNKSYEAVREREERLLARFRQRSIAYWKDGYNQSFWDQLFSMQHYGLPTRLLDWSENLMVSAYFALQSRGAEDDANGDPPVIWCVDPIEWNRGTPSLSGYGETIHVLTTVSEEIESYEPMSPRRQVKYPVAIFGTHNSERIVAQRGTFFVWGNSTDSLEEFCEGDVTANMTRYVLSGSPASYFRDLQSLGFTETMVFPEMSYLAEELKRTEGWRI